MVLGLERALSVDSPAGAGLPIATVLCIVAQHRFMPCCTVHGFNHIGCLE